MIVNYSGTAKGIFKTKTKNHFGEGRHVSVSIASLGENGSISTFLYFQRNQKKNPLSALGRELTRMLYRNLGQTTTGSMRLRVMPS